MRNGALIEVGQVKPGSTFNVPLHALYAAEKELYFSIANYKTSVQGFNWKENPSDFKYMKYLQCDPIHTFEPFYITVSSFCCLNLQTECDCDTNVQIHRPFANVKKFIMK